MSVDFNAIANALATRFDAAHVTAPSGEQNVRLSTASLPQTIDIEPTVLVYPPSSVSLSYGPGTRKGTATFPVRFYIYRVRDSARNAVLINKWFTALYGQLDGQVHLGLSDYVTHADVTLIQSGPLNYPALGQEFHGIELTCEVHVWEAAAFTA